MLISWHAALGAGTTKSRTKPEHLQALEQRLNFAGNVEMTRCLSFAALKEVYAEDDRMLHDAMQIFAEDMVLALETGVEVDCGGTRFTLRLACVGVVGDWPWLIECGNLQRHFRRAPKRGDSQCRPVGICHLCLAGTGSYFFSDASNRPAFEDTMGSAAASLFDTEPSPFTRLLPSQPSNVAWLYRPDVFHNFHLEHGRYMLSSCMVVLLPFFGPGMSMPEAFHALSESWRAWCKENHEKPVLSKITMDKLDFHGVLDWPEPGWQKGSTSTLLSESRCAWVQLVD